MSESKSPWDEFFDPEGNNPLYLSEDESKQLKTAIFDMYYEELYRPLYYRFEEYKRAVRRNYIILIVLDLLLFALLLWGK